MSKAKMFTKFKHSMVLSQHQMAAILNARRNSIDFRHQAFYTQILRTGIFVAIINGLAFYAPAFAHKEIQEGNTDIKLYLLYFCPFLSIFGIIVLIQSVIEDFYLGLYGKVTVGYVIKVKRFHSNYTMEYRFIDNKKNIESGSLNYKPKMQFAGNVFDLKSKKPIFYAIYILVDENKPSIHTAFDDKRMQLMVLTESRLRFLKNCRHYMIIIK